MNPHAQQVIEQFGLAHTKGGSGKGVVGHLQFGVYADGTVYVIDDTNTALREPCHSIDGALGIVRELMLRAQREAQRASQAQ